MYVDYFFENSRFSIVKGLKILNQEPPASCCTSQTEFSLESLAVERF
ncbi:UNVERIFIED_CONTAM: hypothetical protein ABID98_000701 [Brevibacillus sp. OAP136]